MKLNSDQVQERLAQLDGWERDGEMIRKRFTLDSFASAVAFVVRIGFDAEAADHHPDVLISGYKRVTVTFTTHSEGGLTAKDFVGAAAVENVYGKPQAS